MRIRPNTCAESAHVVQWSALQTIGKTSVFRLNKLLKKSLAKNLQSKKSKSFVVKEIVHRDCNYHLEILRSTLAMLLRCDTIRIRPDILQCINQSHLSNIWTGEEWIQYPIPISLHV